MQYIIYNNKKYTFKFKFNIMFGTYVKQEIMPWL